MKDERKKFEQWYAENCFDFKENPIGSRQCDLQWAAWRAAIVNRIENKSMLKTLTVGLFYGCFEVTAPSYSRVPVGEIRDGYNANIVTFPSPKEDWGRVTHLGFFIDNELIDMIIISTSKQVDANDDAPYYKIGSIPISDRIKSMLIEVRK